MMFERFTDSARGIVVRAQEDARRLGHNYIGPEHLLLAAVATGEPAGEVLRDKGVTPERVEAEMLRIIGRGQVVGPLAGLDADALASIGIDLDVVRARLEERFGQDALNLPLAAARQRRGPALGKGPVAELTRRRRLRRAARNFARPSGSGPLAPLAPPASPVPGPSPRGHIPFTPRAKKTLALSLRESHELNDNYIGVQHLILALLGSKDGIVPVILSGLGVPAESLRASVLDRYRKAG